MHVLVTGGAGYIGSHTVVELLQAGHRVTVLDNFCNSSAAAVERVEQIVGRTIDVVTGDIRDRAFLDEVFGAHGFDAVMHFAGLKAVGESVAQPLAYYDNNVNGTLTLCRAMAAAGVHRIVFSSSATVYGDPDTVPITEDCPTGGTTNPYGTSKRMVEQLLEDLASADERWSVALLRYFNPVGAHASGLIGEDPHGIPNNLVPYVSQVAIGRLQELAVFGDDYPTRDGTGVRDYIHVVDLAVGHLQALYAIVAGAGAHVWNLGTGRGHTVLEVIRAFEAASGRSVPYRVVARRAGDVAECWSDPSRAARDLDWRAERGIEQMMADTWRWQSHNPNGYMED